MRQEFQDPSDDLDAKAEASKLDLLRSFLCTVSLQSTCPKSAKHILQQAARACPSYSAGQAIEVRSCAFDAVECLGRATSFIGLVS